MVRSNATTPEEYLGELPDGRRETVAEVRDLILDNLPEGYVEAMGWGMLSYEVPLERYPDTYNGKPLSYLALASQKHYLSLYLMGVYGDEQNEDRLERAFADAGKKMDMGKSCLRFKSVEDLPLEAIADIIASTSVDEFISRYESNRL